MCKNAYLILYTLYKLTTRYIETLSSRINNNIVS